MLINTKGMPHSDILSFDLQQREVQRENEVIEKACFESLPPPHLIFTPNLGGGQTVIMWTKLLFSLHEKFCSYHE